MKLEIFIKVVIKTQSYQRNHLVEQLLFRLASNYRLLCFGGERQFCETVDSERIYDFSDVNMHGTQMEVNIISDYDGPFNYTVGLIK